MPQSLYGIPKGFDNGGYMRLPIVALEVPVESTDTNKQIIIREKTERYFGRTPFI